RDVRTAVPRRADRAGLLRRLHANGHGTGQRVGAPRPRADRDRDAAVSAAAQQRRRPRRRRLRRLALRHPLRVLRDGGHVRARAGVHARGRDRAGRASRRGVRMARVRPAVRDGGEPAGDGGAGRREPARRVYILRRAGVAGGGAARVRRARIASAERERTDAVYAALAFNAASTSEGSRSVVGFSSTLTYLTVPSRPMMKYARLG